MKEFALYEGDTFITLGTYKEIASYLGVNITDIQYLNKKAYKERNAGKENKKILIEIEKE